jgi:hypothetical protein
VGEVTAGWSRHRPFQIRKCCSRCLGNYEGSPYRCLIQSEMTYGSLRSRFAYLGKRRARLGWRGWFEGIQGVRK